MVLVLKEVLALTLHCSTFNDMIVFRKSCTGSFICGAKGGSNPSTSGDISRLLPFFPVCKRGRGRDPPTDLLVNTYHAIRSLKGPQDGSSRRLEADEGQGDPG